MVHGFFFLRDWWSQWSVDRAGVESGRHRPAELRRMLDRGVVTPHTWLRHLWTRRYALVGEVLLMNGAASFEEFEGWFPRKRFPKQTAQPHSPRMSGTGT